MNGPVTIIKVIRNVKLFGYRYAGGCIDVWILFVRNRFPLIALTIDGFKSTQFWATPHVSIKLGHKVLFQLVVPIKIYTQYKHSKNVSI